MEKLPALAACPCLTSLTHEPAAFQLSEAEPRAARRASDSTQQRHTQPLSATGKVTFTKTERRASRKQLLTPQWGRDPKHKAPRFLDTAIMQEPHSCSTFQGGHSLPPRFLKLFISTSWKGIYCLNSYLVGLNTHSLFPHVKCHLIKTSPGGHSLGIKKSPPSCRL